MSFNITEFDLEGFADEEIEEETNLNSLTVAELKAIAKEKGIPGYYNMTKQQLIDAINETP